MNKEMFSCDSAKPLYKYLTELSKTYGNIFTFSAGFGKPIKMIILNSADVINQALVNQSGHFDGRPSVWSLSCFSKNQDILLSNPSPAWKLSRRLATSGFRNFLSGSRLDGKVHCSFEKGIALLTESNGKPIDMKSVLDLLVYNVICDMLFGIQFDLDDEDFKKIQETIKKSDQQVSDGLLEDWLPFWQYSPIKTSFTKDFMKIVDYFLGYITRIVEEHHNKYNPDNISDLIDYLIQAKEKIRQEDAKLADQFTQERIVHIVSDAFFAGVDTTSHTLYWTMYFMAKYPHIQEKVHMEIDEAIGSLLPKISDKQKMVYCEAVMYETIRFAPVAPLGLFHATTTENAKINEFDIPADAQIITNIWACHHDPREWKNPEEFIPERFIHEDKSLIAKPKSWLPFSAGRRACIGENVAKQEIFIFFTSILQKFNIRFEDDSVSSQPIQFENNAFLCTPQPYKVIVTPRG
ncbi:cytochrome P450 2U1-like isoform X2 [Tubulanus polymorphus]|uniref:cytochrome P450 2U1-like isoform X2 n=1 Tax=Tubulanus polymorphus TaxID=672921 RepID=UPI003DA58D4D